MVTEYFSYNVNTTTKMCYRKINYYNQGIHIITYIQCYGSICAIKKCNIVVYTVIHTIYNSPESEHMRTLPIIMFALILKILKNKYIIIV